MITCKQETEAVRASTGLLGSWFEGRSCCRIGAFLEKRKEVKRG